VKREGDRIDEIAESIVKFEPWCSRRLPLNYQKRLKRKTTERGRHEWRETPISRQGGKSRNDHHSKA
jgi:hypothetical protein